MLTGTGGISGVVSEIIAACEKETGARVVYDAAPERLVDALLDLYRREHYQHPSCFCSGYGDGSRAAQVFRTARDLVCGMWIEPETAPAARIHEGRRYVFCSADCAERFDTDAKGHLLRSPRSV